MSERKRAGKQSMEVRSALTFCCCCCATYPEFTRTSVLPKYTQWWNEKATEQTACLMAATSRTLSTHIFSFVLFCFYFFKLR